MRSALILILLAAGLAGCNRNSDKNAVSKSGEPTRSGRDTTRKALYPEADAVAILRALDSAEIATSAVARDASQNDVVRSYAVVMIKDHRDIMHLVDSLGVELRDNAISTRIRTEGDSIAHALGNIAVGLNNTYIEEQVKAHEQALQLLDTAIIPSAQNAQLKTLLTQLRPTILAHYQRAVQILAERHRQADERHEPWVSGLYAKPAAPAPSPVAPSPIQPLPRDTTTPPITTTTSQ